MRSLLNKGLIAVFFASLFYGVQSVFMRFIGTDFGVFYPFVVRGLIIASILAVFIYLTHSYKKILSKDYKWFLLMPISGIITFITIFIAINHIKIGTTLFLHYASLTSTGFILGYLFFKEKLNQVKFVSLFLSIIGLFLIFSAPRLQEDILYLLLAFASGVGSSLWYLMSKKISSKYPYSQILAIDSAIVFLLCAIFAIFLKETFYLPNFSFQWASVIGLTAVSFGAYLLSVYGFRFLQAQIASLVLLLEVVFGLFLAWILFFEIPTIQALAGGVLILISAALPNLVFKKVNQKIGSNFLSSRGGQASGGED